MTTKNAGKNEYFDAWQALKKLAFALLKRYNEPFIHAAKS